MKRRRGDSISQPPNRGVILNVADLPASLAALDDVPVHESPLAVVAATGAGSHVPDLSADDDALSSFVWPVPADAFMRHIWSRRALAVHGAGLTRAQELLHDLHGGDLEALLESTPSDTIGAWLPARESGMPCQHVLQSVRIPDTAAALAAAASGAALYFRAEDDVAAKWTGALAQALGAAWGATYPDGAPRGEIEIFVAPAGHFTPWHNDFQHNFTVQLTGHKTWQLRAGTSFQPVRGATPHFADAANIEEQVKVGRWGDARWRRVVPSSVECEVTLGPGDMLSFPAGMWHCVQTGPDGPALSANCSLLTPRWADLASASIRQTLLRDVAWRAPIAVSPAASTLMGLGSAGATTSAAALPALQATRTALQSALDTAQARVQAVLQPAVLLPRALLPDSPDAWRCNDNTMLHTALRGEGEIPDTSGLNGEMLVHVHPLLHVQLSAQHHGDVLAADDAPAFAAAGDVPLAIATSIEATLEAEAEAHAAGVSSEDGDSSEPDEETDEQDQQHCCDHGHGEHCHDEHASVASSGNSSAGSVDVLPDGWQVWSLHLAWGQEDLQSARVFSVATCPGAASAAMDTLADLTSSAAVYKPVAMGYLFDLADASALCLAKQLVRLDLLLPVSKL